MKTPDTKAKLLNNIRSDVTKAERENTCLFLSNEFFSINI